MSTFFFPPPPQVANSPQPNAGHATVPPDIAGVPVNNPPFGTEGSVPENLAVVYGWAPDPWIYNYLGRGQPYQPRTLNPGVLNVPVNDPPFVARGRLSPTMALITTWQPDPWVYLFHGWSQPYQKGRLPTASAPIPVNEPPYGSVGRNANIAAIIATVQPDPWTFSFMGRNQPFEGRKLPPQLMAVRVDNPPWTLTSWDQKIASVTVTWQPPPPWEFMGGTQMLVPRKLPPQFMAVRVDAPPFSSRRVNFWTISAAWEQPPPLPTLQHTSVYDILPLSYSFGIIII